jgi:hypothetical protein
MTTTEITLRNTRIPPSMHACSTGALHSTPLHWSSIFSASWRDSGLFDFSTEPTFCGGPVTDERPCAEACFHSICFWRRDTIVRREPVNASASRLAKAWGPSARSAWHDIHPFVVALLPVCDCWMEKVASRRKLPSVASVISIARRVRTMQEVKSCVDSVCLLISW